jgi:carbohydrate kinase (thermoresistant glucokinase family)
MPHALPPQILVLMGVAGSGKSTVGRQLSASLGWPFRDADEFHPPANIAKMSAGTPLTDGDRWPWLDAIAAWIDERRRAQLPGIVSCSALKRGYRRRIIGAREGVRLVYLQGGEALIAARLAARKGHFMPAALLRSQLDVLEAPQADERPLVVSIDATPEAIAAAIVLQLGEGTRGG